MADEEFEQIVLLNRLTSRSKSRAPQEHKPPLHGAEELFGLIGARFTRGLAIEYFGRIVEELEEDEDELTSTGDDAPFHGAGLDFMRLSDMRYIQKDGARYLALLFEYVNQRIRTLPVVHTVSFEGREIGGDEEERGAFSAHLVLQLPGSGAYDDGTYRCCIEAVKGISRQQIGHFIRRQIARAIGKEKWTFEVVVPAKKKSQKDKKYKYWPRLDLLADVGRSISSATEDGRSLTHFVFTKRAERQNIADATDVKHDDIVADVEIKVHAANGPADLDDRKGWLAWVRQQYESRGYETKLYYRHLHGSRRAADIHQSMESAADLILCPRDVITLPYHPKVWLRKIDDTVVGEMIKLIEKDELWERRRSD